MDEKMKCEVVQDLLPLYVDGACTDGSKALVEEHVKTCPGCKKLLEEMLAPLPAQAEMEEPRDLMPQKVLKKLQRRNVVICLLVAVVAIIVSPILYLSHNTWQGRGISWTNLDEFAESLVLMELWQKEGTEAFLNELEPVLLYETYTTAPDEQELQRYFGMNGGEAYVPIELDGHRFMMAEHIYDQMINSTHTPYTEYRALMEEGNMDELWRRMMRDEVFTLVLPEDVYERLGKTDGYWEKLSLDCGEYYYLPMEHYGKIDFPDAMYDNVEGIEPLDESFFIIRNALIVPEELYQLHSQMMEPIAGWYEAYAAYWQGISYEQFSASWRWDMQRILDEAELIATNAVFHDMVATGREDCYIISWDVAFSGGNSLQIHISEYEGNYYLIYTLPLGLRSNDLAVSINEQLPSARVTVYKD